MPNKRIILFTLVALLLMLCLSITRGGQPAVDGFIFLEELLPGMEGMGKTVVSGNEIETFQVRIIDIVDNPGQLDDHILIRASGEAIERSGGIAAGMSGSPIYIDGKLVGAIWGAAEFDVSSEPIALVRPIETMLKLLQPVREKLAARAGEAVSKRSLERSALIEIPTLKGIKLRKLSTPVWISGLNGRSSTWLRDGLDQRLIEEGRGALLPLALLRENFLNNLELGLGKRFDLTFYNIGVQNLISEQGDPSGKTGLKPGSAVGAMLATGDVSIGSFGTLTYREDDLCLSFGHPFLLRGGTEMFLTSIKILDTVQSLQIPFKFGVPDRRLGAFLEDRFQGIAGALGIQPNAVALRITVRDSVREVRRNFDVDLISDPDLLPSLLYSVILSSIDTTINRIGPGTLKVDYVFRGDRLKSNIARDDIFHSFSDIATSAPLQIAQVAYLLEWNEFADLGLDRIDVEITVDQEVRLYEIRELTTDKEVYHPGDELQYTVTVKPFRSDVQEIQGSIKIPEDVEEGALTLHAFGGSLSAEEGEEDPQFGSLEELIAAIEGMESNDQLTVELLGVSGGESDEQAKRPASLERKENYVIVGEKFAQLKIEKAEEQTEEQPKQEGKGQEECDQLFYCD
jgi:hypothetical protein